MQYGLRKLLSCLLACTVLLLSFSFISNAAEHPELKVKLSSTEDNYVISVYITKPEDVLSVDLTLLFNEALKFNKISFEGTDTDRISFDSSSFSASDSEDKTRFELFYTKDKGVFRLTGYFLEPFSSENDFYLCDILISKNENTDTAEIAELNFTISTKRAAVRDHISFSLQQNEDIISGSIEESSQLGDANGDGTVSAEDARLILRHSVGLDRLPLKYFPYADFDRNGDISSADARLALRTAVSLEKPVFNRFEYSLQSGDGCENGGTYRFCCTLTNTVFTAEYDSTEHIYSDGDCYLPSVCIICSKENAKKQGHDFENSDICKNCSISKSSKELFEESITGYLNAAKHHDDLAKADIERNNISAFIKDMKTSTENLKSALNCCKETIGTRNIREKLEKAYQIRYQAFISCTNSNGQLPCTKETLKILSDALSVSEYYTSTVYSAFSDQ